MAFPGGSTLAKPSAAVPAAVPAAVEFDAVKRGDGAEKLAGDASLSPGEMLDTPYPPKLSTPHSISISTGLKRSDTLELSIWTATSMVKVSSWQCSLVALVSVNTLR